MIFNLLCFQKPRKIFNNRLIVFLNLLKYLLVLFLTCELSHKLKWVNDLLFVSRFNNFGDDFRKLKTIQIWNCKLWNFILKPTSLVVDELKSLDIRKFLFLVHKFDPLFWRTFALCWRFLVDFVKKFKEFNVFFWIQLIVFFLH